MLARNGAISALVKHLQPLERIVGDDNIPCEYEVEEKCARAISRIAIRVLS